MKFLGKKTTPMIVRFITLLAFFATSFLLFAQVFIPEYLSDWSLHLGFIKYPQGDTNYSLLHIVLSYIYKTTDNFHIVSMALAFLGFFSNVISYFLVRDYLLKKIDKEKYIVELLSLTLFFVSMIIVPLRELRYLGIGTPNPWHNPTYSLCRPFAIGSFILITKVNELFQQNKKFIKYLILLSITLFLSVLMKPSFYFVFLPATFLYYLYVLIKGKFKKFWDCVLLGLSVVPAGLVLVVQNIILFGEENAIAITLQGKLWRGYAPYGSVLLAIILGMAFPLFVTFTNIKKLSFEHILVALACVFGTIEAYFFIEEGPRYQHGNFLWGYYFCMFFAFLISLITFVNNKEKTKTYKVIGWSLFSLHLLCGIFYFAEILFGHSYF